MGLFGLWFWKAQCRSAGSIALALWYHLVVCRTEQNNSHHQPGSKGGKPRRKMGPAHPNSCRAHLLSGLVIIHWALLPQLLPVVPPQGPLCMDLPGQLPPSEWPQRRTSVSSVKTRYLSSSWFFPCILQNPVQEEVLHRTDLELPEFIFHVR